MKDYQINRAKKIIENAIDLLKLNLSEKIVLTEVGSGYFVYTPIIALMANAKKVFAWSKDSKYGKAEDIMNQCDIIIKKLGIENRLEYSLNNRKIQHIKSADIITNLGFVRPLNEEFLNSVNNRAVITGMCEAWEIRSNDVNIELCKQKGIKVAGTWENHPDLKKFF